MRCFVIIPVLAMSVVLMAVTVRAQENAQAGMPALSQPLLREGTLAVSLASALMIARQHDEAEAERALSEVGIAPKNGWIADYPVTPDIVGELQASIREAASSDKISVRADSALKTFQDLMAEYSFSVTAAISDQGESSMSAPNYPDSEIVNGYYYDEGPPVVTYYSPPQDYAYLYTWVAYPFWCSGVRFPGFFILADFHVRVHYQRRDEFISNHYRDSETGKMSRIDAANRAEVTAMASSDERETMSSIASVGMCNTSTCSSCHQSASSVGRLSGYSGNGRASFSGGNRSFSGSSFGAGGRK